MTQDLVNKVEQEIRNWESYIIEQYAHDPMRAGELDWRCFAFLSYWYDMDELLTPTNH